MIKTIQQKQMISANTSGLSADGRDIPCALFQRERVYSGDHSIATTLKCTECATAMRTALYLQQRHFVLYDSICEGRYVIMRIFLR